MQSEAGKQIDSYFFFREKYLHHILMPHVSHFGFRAVQTYRPCNINQWCAIGIRFSGIFLTSVCSVSYGVLLLLVSPIRLDTRKTCVSTAIAGLSKTTDAITLAVFLPTPGNSCN